MSTINKQELIEWLEDSIAKDKDAMAEAHGFMSNYGRSCYIVQAEMTLDHIRALPSRPSDAELLGWAMDKCKDHDFLLFPQWSGFGDSDLQTWTLVHKGKIYSWKRGEPMFEEARAILEPEYNKFLAASQPPTAKDE